MDEAAQVPVGEDSAAGSVQVEEPAKKKRGKPKDALAPKKPQNPYQQFTARRRPELKELEPALASDLSAIGKRMAEDWKETVPQEEKDRLQALYDKDMAVWKPLFIEYKKTDAYKEFFEVKQDYLDIKSRKKLNKTMNKDAPKRPKSGFMLYTGGIREEVMEKVKAEGLGMGDGARIMSERWNAVPESEKARYAEESAAAKIVFDIEFLKYRQSDAHKNYVTAKSKMEAAQTLKKLTRTTMADAPKRAPSAYALYRNEVMPGIVEDNEKKEEKLDVGKLGKLVAEMWTNVDAEKKQKYYSEAEQLKEEYEAKFKDWKGQVKYSKFLENRAKVKKKENLQVNLRDLPKRPKSVFALFAQEHKKDVPQGKGEGKGTHALKSKWTDAAKEEKEKYEAKEKELKTEWMKAVAEFKDTESYKLFETTKHQIEIEFSKEAEKATTLRFLQDAPNPPAKTPFAVFLGEKRKRDGSENVRRSKQAKVEELKSAQAEWFKLDREVKNEYEEKRKELKKSFEQSCKNYMESDKWKDYMKEAKRIRIPIRTLLFNKRMVIKKLNGIITPGSIPLPPKPDIWPDRPKKAMQIFTKEKRSSVEDLSKISEMWNSLGADERGKYDDMAAEQQKQFEQGMKELKQSDEGKKYFRELKGAQRKRIMCGAKIKYLKDLPKKPTAAVVLFMTKSLSLVKKENPQAKSHEVKKLLTDKWVSLGAEGQKPYNEEAKQLMSQYDDAMTAFKRSDNWRGFVRVTTPRSNLKIKAKGITGVLRPPQSMPKRPMGAMQAFAQERPGLKPVDLQKAYAELPEEEKKERMDAAENKKAEYEQSLAEWRKGDDAKRFARMQDAHQKKMKLQGAKKRFLKGEPKKPPGAMQIFSSEIKEKLMAENPGMGLLELSKKTSEAWRDLAPDAKQEVLDKEVAQKTEYADAMEAFKKSIAYRQYDALVKRLSGKGKEASPRVAAPPKPANMPSKPLPALILFARNVGGSLKEQRDAWTKLGSEGQQEWQTKAKEAEQQYEKDLIAFNKTIEGKKYNREKSSFEKKQKMQIAKKRFLGGASAPQEPKKPCSSYFLFVQEKRAGVAQTMEKASMGEVAKKLTELWQNLEPDVKKEFEDKASSLKATYEEDMKAFRESAGYKSFQKAVSGISGAKAKKAEVKAKAKAKKVATKAKVKNAPAAAAAAESGSDSDVMGSDSDDSSSSNSDSD